MKQYFPSLGFVYLLSGLLSLMSVWFYIDWIRIENVDSPIYFIIFSVVLILFFLLYTWNARLELSYDKLVMYDSFMRKHTISAKTHSLDGIEGPDVPVLRNRGDRFIYFRPRNNPKKRLKVNLSIQKPEGYHAVHKWIENNYSK